MREYMQPYVDAGWSAAAILLSLARIEQKRPIPRDRKTLQTVAGALDNFAQGAYEQEAETPLFSQIEGLLVFVRTMHEWDQPPAEGDIRQRASDLAVMLRGFLEGTREGERQGALLRKFFRKVHDVAEEVTATGLPFDPVVEVFSSLAKSRQAVRARR